jgi:outer membrane protein assembly factor BamB/Ca2+-binding EF-hand superfamily protein
MSNLLLRRAGALSFLAIMAAVPLAQAEPWSQWRGPNRDGLSREQGLLQEWPEQGPEVVWQVENVGVGYSSLEVRGDWNYTQGDLNGVEHVIALNARDGSRRFAVLPEPVERQLAERVSAEMKQTDRNGDGVVDEAEALARLGWNFNKSDAAGDGSPSELAEMRVARLMQQLDDNEDGKLTFAETGPAFRDVFVQIDAPDAEVDAEALAKQRTAEFVASLDKDNDGQVSKDEARRSLLEQPFNRTDARPPGAEKGDELLSAAEIEAHLLKLEKGRDGLLTAAELSDYYARVFPGRDGMLTADELRSYYGGYRNGQGDGPRGTPTLDEERLYAEGANGDLTCLEATTGKTLWHRNLVKDFGGGRPGWGYCESPLVVGNMLIVTPGGKQGTLAALDKMTGETLWRSSDVQQAAHYSSPVVAELAGVRQVVQFARESVFGVRLGDGALLWKYSGANNGTANIATPIAAENHVFATSAYGTGGGLVQIIASGDGQRSEEVYFEKKMANHHGGLVLVGEHLYGFGNGGLICMHYLTGKIAWTARSVGKGSLVYADGMLYCLGEGHQMALVEANPGQYVEHGRFQIENLGRPSWAHPVVADGKLFLRNLNRLTAYNVRR